MGGVGPERRAWSVFGLRSSPHPRHRHGGSLRCGFPKPPDPTVSEPAPHPVRMPVSVLIEQRHVSVGRWTQPHWEVRAVVAGTGVVQSVLSRTLVSRERGCEIHMWTGLAVELFRDGCEGYWYNLKSGRPCLFVVCSLDGESDDSNDDGLSPMLVTANQDEASAHLESDDPVFSVPMPDRVRQWVEHFVVRNYRPEVKRKRRRRDWSEE